MECNPFQFKSTRSGAELTVSKNYLRVLEKLNVKEDTNEEDGSPLVRNKK